MAEPRNHVLSKLGRPLGIASVVVGLTMVGWSQVRVQYLVDQVAHEADLRVATQCVAANERVQQLKALGAEAVRSGARVGAEAASNALIQIGIEQGSPPGPGIEERYRQLLAEYVSEQSDAEVARVQATVQVVTECDLKASKELLAGT